MRLTRAALCFLLPLSGRSVRFPMQKTQAVPLILLTCFALAVVAGAARYDGETLSHMPALTSPVAVVAGNRALTTVGYRGVRLMAACLHVRPPVRSQQRPVQALYASECLFSLPGRMQGLLAPFDQLVVLFSGVLSGQHLRR